MLFKIKYLWLKSFFFFKKKFLFFCKKDKILFVNKKYLNILFWKFSNFVIFAKKRFFCFWRSTIMMIYRIFCNTTYFFFLYIFIKTIKIFSFKKIFFSVKKCKNNKRKRKSFFTGKHKNIFIFYKTRIVKNQIISIWRFI